ncbi:hypothetical protein H8E06_00075 [bacterium]|nr:hypothetical protein [bacterium]
MNRFNLETDIIKAWSNTEDDIDDILYAHFDKASSRLSDEELKNALRSLKLKHNLRMGRAWDTFTQIIKDKSFEPPIGEDCEPETGTPYDNTLGVQGESKC